MFSSALLNMPLVSIYSVTVFRNETPTNYIPSPSPDGGMQNGAGGVGGPTGGGHGGEASHTAQQRIKQDMGATSHER